MFFVPPRLLEVGRNLNKADTEGLKQCAYYFKQLDQVQLKEYSFFFFVTKATCMWKSRLITSRPLISSSKWAKRASMHEVAQQQSERRSLQVDLFRLNGFESYYRFTREKMIDICCVRSGVKYRSLSYWSVIMTSLVEFSTGEFRAKQVWIVF